MKNQVRRRILQCFFHLLLFSPLGIIWANVLEGDSQSNSQSELANTPIDDFFVAPNEYQYVLSPDGRYLAYIFGKPRSYALRITDLEEKRVIRSIDLSRQYPRYLRWLDNRRLSYVVEGRLHAINRDGSDLRVLISNLEGKKGRSYTIRTLRRDFRGWSVASTLPKDPENILVKSMNLYGYESVHKVNVFTGENKTLFDGHKHKIDEWLIGPDGDARLAVKARKGKITFYEVGDDSERLRPKPVKNVDIDFSGATFLEKRVRILQGAADANSLYVASNLNADRFSVGLLNLDTGEIQTLVSDPDYDVGDVDAGFEMYTDKHTNELLGVGYATDRWVTHWLDENFKNVQERIDELYPAYNNTVLGWDDAKERFLIRSWNATSYGRIHIFDVRTGQVLLQNAHITPLENKADYVETVRYQTADGSEIEAFLYQPLTKGPSESRPLIVNPHGGPFARSYRAYHSTIAYFVAQGYVVLQPNFRGSVGYGRKHLLAGRGQLHDLMVRDVEAGVRWVLDQKLADPNKVYALGASYGGYAVLMSSIANPGMYQAVVSLSAPLDMKRQLDWYKDNKYHYAQEFWEEMSFAKNSSRSFLREISPHYLSNKIAVPTLLVHGQEDDTVPVKHLEVFKKRLDSKKYANPNIELITLKDEGHSIALKSNKIYLAEKILRLFERVSAVEKSGP